MMNYIKGFELKLYIKSFITENSILQNDAKKFLLTKTSPLERQIIYWHAKDEVWTYFSKKYQRIIQSKSIDVDKTSINQDNAECRIRIKDNYRTRYHGYPCYSHTIYINRMGEGNVEFAIATIILILGLIVIGDIVKRMRKANESSSSL